MQNNTQKKALSSDSVHLGIIESMSYLSGLDVRHQPFPCGTVKITAAPSVIGIVAAVGVASLLGISFEVFFLRRDLSRGVSAK